jgi:hypothetical protein
MFVLLGADCVESADAPDPGSFPGFGPPPPTLLDADEEALLPWSTGPLPPPFPTLTDALSFFGPCCFVEALLVALWPVLFGAPGSAAGDASACDPSDGPDAADPSPDASEPGSMLSVLPAGAGAGWSVAVPDDEVSAPVGACVSEGGCAAFPLPPAFPFPFVGAAVGVAAESATVGWPVAPPLCCVPANAGGATMKKMTLAASVAARPPPNRITRLRRRVCFLAGGIRSSRRGALDHDPVAACTSRMSTVARRVRSSRPGALDHDSAIREEVTST